MGDKKNTPVGVGFFSIQDIVDGIHATEKMTDTTIAAGAKVVCTAAVGCKSESRMVKGASCLLLQKSIELGHKDIEFFPLYTGCMVGDHVCKPEIERGEWQDYNETKRTSTGDYSLLKDKSYMLCTKGFGIIYATDNGQKIDERQARSMAILFKRWQDNPDVMGYLKGVGNCYAYSKDPVNLNTGNFIYEHVDLNISGVIPLVFKRFYNATDTRIGCLGEGWIHNYEMFLKFRKDRLILFLGDGKEERYDRVSDDLYRNSHTGIETIQVVKRGIESSYVYTTLDQKKHIFDQTGKESSREDAYGNRLELEYDLSERLVKVESCGAKLNFNYDDMGRLVRVEDHTGRNVQFDHDETVLKKMIDPDGMAIEYRYDKNRKIQEIVNVRGGSTIYNEYDHYFRTIKQRFPDEGEVTYVYCDEEKMVEMTEQNGNRVKHYYDEQYRNVKTVYEDGKEEFVYNKQNRRIRYKDKRGYLTRYEYDRNGNETKQVDALGNRTHKTYNRQNQLLTVSINGVMKQKNQYDKKGNLIKTTDALERSCEFCYSSQGLPVEMMQADGGKYSFEYDERGNLAVVQDPGGYRTYYEYDDLNRISQTIDANGNYLYYKYDNRDNLIGVMNCQGKEQKYTYNENNKVTSFMDYSGNIVYQEYDKLNKPCRVIDQMGNETKLEYDQMWNLCKVTNANGGETSYTYNHNNLLECISNPLGGLTIYNYDPNGNRIKTIDPNGGVMGFTYDSLNRITEIKNADGAVWHYEYNAEGEIIAYTDPLGQSIRYEYDDAGQKVKEINALGEETIFCYNPLGKLTKVKKEDRYLVKYEYDSRGLLTRESHLDGIHINYYYDGNKNLIKKTDQRGYVLEYEYDNSDRVMLMRSNQGQESRYVYDMVGNLTEVTDANNNTTRYLYDPCGHLIGVIDAEGNQTVYGYDEMGNLTHILQGEEKLLGDLTNDFEIEEVLKLNKQKQGIRVTNYQRNQAGQVEQIIDALGNIERYSYDVAGNLTGKIDKEGYLTSYTYHASGDLGGIRYGDGREVKLNYNALRQLIEVEDWLGTTRIESDALGRTVKVTDHKNRVVAYEYGTCDEKKKVIYPDSQAVAYEYDECLRLTTIENGDNRVVYKYDSQGNLNEKYFGKGLKSTYIYNPSGQLTALTHWDQKGKLDEYKYCYDAMGNKIEIEKQRTGMRQESGVYRYKYDALNRLSRVSKDGYLLRHYRYDCYGNRVERTDGRRTTRYTYNILNQLVHRMDGWLDNEMGREREESYAYDKRGNLTEVHKNGMLVNQYCFGALNRLEAARNHKTGISALYHYNGLGDRVGKTVGENIDPLSPKVSQEGLNPTKEIEDVLDLTRRYHNLLQRQEAGHHSSFIWGDHLINTTREDGVTHLYLQDELGSPIRLMDDNGGQVGIYDYDEFGNDSHSGRSEVQPFGYTSYQRDSVTNTYFAQAREYVPDSGRFISEDTIKGTVRHPFTLNQYGYCWNRPVNFVDPDGRLPIFVVIAVAAAIGVGLTGCSSNSKPDIPDAKSSTAVTFKQGEKDYNSSEAVQKSSNCYAYAFNEVFNDNTGYKHIQPGEHSGMTMPDLIGVKSSDKKVSELVNIIKADANAMGKTFVEYTNGMTGGYAVALVINPTNGDYHWYRENGDGTWSHKQGQMEATDQIGYKVDSWGNAVFINGKITDPEAAAKQVGYDVFVGYYYLTCNP